jgi:hypothetical protein
MHARDAGVRPRPVTSFDAAIMKRQLLAVLASSFAVAAPLGGQVPRLERHFQSPLGADSAKLFSTISGVTLGPSGSIYVLQPDAAEVQLLDRGGRLVRRFGGYGLGPGEFRNPRRIGWLRDTLWVVDDRHNRVSFFSPAGEFLSSTQLPRPWALDIAALHEHTLLADGALLVYAAPVSTSDGASNTAPPAAVVRIGLAGRPIDTLLLVDQAAEAYRVPIRVKGHEGHQVGRQPFADAPLWAVAADGSRVVLIDRSPSPARRTFEVTMLDTRGTRLWRVEIPFEPRAIPEALIVAVMDSIHRFTARPEVELRKADLRLALRVPRFAPPVTDVVIGRDGRTWLRRASGLSDSTTYTVLGPGGRVLGDVRLPHRGQVATADARNLIVIEGGASDSLRLVGYWLLDGGR